MTHAGTWSPDVKSRETGRSDTGCHSGRTSDIVTVVQKRYHRAHGWVTFGRHPGCSAHYERTEEAAQVTEPGENRAFTGWAGDGHGSHLSHTISSNAVSVGGHSEPANVARIFWSGDGLGKGTGGRRFETAPVQSECLGNQLGR